MARTTVAPTMPPAREMGPTGFRSNLRGVQDGVFWGLCGLALLAIIAPSVWIVVGLLRDTWPVLTPKLLTNTTAHDGLQNAILGTLLLSVGVLIVAGILGIAAGIYISEFSRGRLGRVLRFLSEVLAGIPSIVVGYTGYVLLVVAFGWKYSLLAAVFALTTIVIPYIVKTTEVSLGQVPTNLREGARALGLPMVATLRKVLLPPALPGIVTGLVVALAISTGETAPLLYTAGFTDQNPTLHLTGYPVPYLTYVVFTDIQLPSEKAHELANAAAVVTLFFLLLLIFAGRALAVQAAKRTARMSV
jgi:phosphate transport system permease protein